MTVRVLIADDQPLVRTGLRTILDNAGGFDIVGEAADGQEALAQAGALRPDVVLMDVRMPQLDGIAATRRIRAAPGAPKVLVLTTFDLDEYVYAGLRAGASGFLLKDARAADLVSAIHAVHAGDAVVAPSATRRLIERFLDSTPEPDRARTHLLTALTEREREVLVKLARGLSNAEIAASLYLSEGTVKTYVSRILTKLGLRDRVQAVVFAYDTGLTRPGE
ncbi:response regulator transcription factor [Acrocarpospora macrocephala]|uniref:DNA-binding response regulator n=1 Tax=Acrocarpospora macrocephala TaxID=150177 RepID=A0A5M3X424_9ACTN|nr:response regulator transcription factor [Acrocarpospora macrocephala]GES13593.1 DNA-binding response regulator [Acrocarpospora macrocephala]